MKTIQNQYFDGERPLYESRDLRLERVRIGEGESGLKESRHIEAADCEFEGMYVIWECEDVTCRNCHFAESDRAPLWYNRNIRLYDCLIDAPKAFREVEGLELEKLQISNAASLERNPSVTAKTSSSKIASSPPMPTEHLSGVPIRLPVGMSSQNKNPPDPLNL